MTRRAAGGLLVTLTALAACTDAGPVSGPGTIDAVLVSPHGAEGAALVVLTGGGIGRAVGLGDTEVYRSDDSGSTRVVLMNRVGGGLAFRIEMADTTRLPTAVIQQVAGPATSFAST
ncbi:MAG: hypothetical protein EXR91_03485 [Gemmatimonadetes bacterium]|nr:hypothetical protein [Gemmatimonadota bacterium]